MRSDRKVRSEDGADEREEEEEEEEGGDETCTDDDESDPEWQAPAEDRKARRSTRTRFQKGRCRTPSSAPISGELSDFSALLKILESQAHVSDRCGRPQPSYATKDAVTLSWRIPAKAIGKELFTYEIQQCVVSEPTSTDPLPDSVTAGIWGAIPNPVSGFGYELGHLHTCSWIVSGLPTGQWVALRVRITNCATYAEWSLPSQPFKIGCMCYSPVGTGVGGDTWTEAEMAFFRTLNTPMKVQDYLDTIPMNQEIDSENPDVSLSALECVRQNHGHCLEGAILGAYILGLHGYGTLLMDLRACASDYDHVITPFQWKGRWGSLSVSNHASLRYRNPVYLSLRELVMSYFDDYMNNEGVRRLRHKTKILSTYAIHAIYIYAVV